MKISPINFLNTAKTYTNNLNNNVYPKQPVFTGIFDVFQKSNNTKEEKECDRIIGHYFKHEALKDDKTLRFDAFPLNTNLKTLLKIGKKLEYRSYLPTVRTEKDATNISFGQFDEDIQAPSVINFWREGKLLANYEIYQLEPEMFYSYTKYDNNTEKQYVVEDNKITSFFACDNEGKMIFHFPYENGFKRQEACRITDKEAVIITEMLYDSKNPENSYYKENTEDGIIEYKFDKNKKMWKYYQTIKKPDLAKN